MRNLLPEPQQKKVRREYRMRVATVALFLISGAFLIGGAALVPSYAASLLQLTSIEQQAKTIESSITQRTQNVSIDDLQATRARMEFLAEVQQNVSVRAAVESAVDSRPAGIVLSEFRYTKGEEEDILELKGNAQTRASLLSFERALRSSGAFVNVELPVSSLAQDSDIEFSIRTLLENDKS